MSHGKYTKVCKQYRRSSLGRFASIVYIPPSYVILNSIIMHNIMVKIFFFLHHSVFNGKRMYIIYINVHVGKGRYGKT